MKYALIVLFSLLMTNAKAQDISSHRWENRIILIIADEPSNKELKEQMEELKVNCKGLGERNLIIYQILPDKYRIGLDEKEEWLQSSALYEKYKPKKGDFKIILIGLDGGIKIQDAKPLSSETLFATIDSMPMRQTELRKKGNL